MLQIKNKKLNSVKLTSLSNKYKSFIYLNVGKKLYNKIKTAKVRVKKRKFKRICKKSVVSFCGIIWVV